MMLLLVHDIKPVPLLSPAIESIYYFLKVTDKRRFRDSESKYPGDFNRNIFHRWGL